MSHPQGDTLYPSVGEEAQPRVAGLENSIADGRPKSEYVPFVSLKVDNDFFAMVVEQTGTIRAGSAISGTGFGEVYDQKGRLVRRYAAIEDTNSSWKLMEFMFCQGDRWRRNDLCDPHGPNQSRRPVRVGGGSEDLAREVAGLLALDVPDTVLSIKP